MESADSCAVFVVEDDPIIAFDLESMLEESGVGEIRVFRDNASALAAIETRTPDYAILDWKLAAGTSIETAAMLRSLGVPVAFVTGYGEHVPLPPALADCPIFSKPVDRRLLAAFVACAKPREGA